MPDTTALQLKTRLPQGTGLVRCGNYMWKILLILFTPLIIGISVAFCGGEPALHRYNPLHFGETAKQFEAHERCIHETRTLCPSTDANGLH